VIRRLHLTGFRAVVIYSPALMSMITAPLQGRDSGPAVWAHSCSKLS
jgi:hypothetical protein